MQQLIFATNNRNKVAEVKAILGKDFNVISLEDAGINIEIPEPHNTLEENASEKSTVIYGLTHQDCFSEDTGLEAEALNGEPGVKSARYADHGAFDSNIDKLLHELKDANNRNARFRTVISLRLNGKEYKFEGVCKGTIIANRRGVNGFGYDPVFVPEGATKTFAEMDMSEKNFYSHRKKAVAQLVEFLQKNNQQ